MKFNIGWGLTNKCNMNCKFCYSKETRHRSSELGINDWKRFIDENYNLIDSINYGTGENAILDDFFEFIYYVRMNYPQIKQALTTNGFLYDRIRNDDDKRYKFINSIDEVDVSLDFPIQEQHTDFRGQPSAFIWALKTLEFLSENNIKSTIVFVGFNDTLKKENIDGLFKIAKKYNSLIRMNIYRPVSESEEINKRYIADYNTLKNAIEYMLKKYSLVSMNDILFGNIYTNESIIENTGVDSIRILPDGKICPSTYLISSAYSQMYNITEHNVLQRVKFPEFTNPSIPKECKNCQLYNKCRGGVYDRRVLWNKTLDKRDPYCPYEHEDDIEKIKYKQLKRTRVSVHDGYLPTIFFKNKDGD